MSEPLFFTIWLVAASILLAMIALWWLGKAVNAIERAVFVKPASVGHSHRESESFSESHLEYWKPVPVTTAGSNTFYGATPPPITKFDELAIGRESAMLDQALLIVRTLVWGQMAELQRLEEARERERAELRRRRREKM
jgi:hypothetical protein